MFRAVTHPQPGASRAQRRARRAPRRAPQEAVETSRGARSGNPSHRGLRAGGGRRRPGRTPRGADAEAAHAQGDPSRPRTCWARSCRRSFCRSRISCRRLSMPDRGDVAVSGGASAQSSFRGRGTLAQPGPPGGGYLSSFLQRALPARPELVLQTGSPASFRTPEFDAIGRGPMRAAVARAGPRGPPPRAVAREPVPRDVGCPRCVRPASKVCAGSSAPVLPVRPSPAPG